MIPEIAQLLAPTGVRVVRGTSRTICEIWLCKDLEVAGEKPPGNARYPLREGQLIGVIHFPGSGSDIRDQKIEKGTYTLRYARIPVDGDHQGASPTPDFLLIVLGAEDKSPADIPAEDLTKRSADAVGTDHPGSFALTPVLGENKAASIRQDEERDFWIARLQTTAKADGSSKELMLDLVVVGTVEQ